MTRGIIYKYTSPSGKSYIGQTINEVQRRYDFRNLNETYAGLKIENARHKYSPEEFEYEVLEEIYEDEVEKLYSKLDDLEIEYISKFDTFKNGYNMSLGGAGSRGWKMSPEQHEKHVQRMLTNNPFKGKEHNEQSKRAIGDANSKAVIQIDPNTNEEIRLFSSALEAGKYFGRPRANSEIVKVCRGYVSPSGRHYLTALGYKWKYKD